MALSGRFETNKTSAVGENYPRSLVCSWTATQSIDDNTSTVSWTLKTGDSTNEYNYVYISNISLWFNGTRVYYDGTQGDHKYKSNTTISSGTINIPHNADGKKSASVSLEAGIYNWSPNVNYSGTITLDQIPRQATISSAPNFNDEENPTITYSNLAGNAVDKLQVCITLNGSNDDIKYRDVSKTGSSYTFQLTEAERNILRKNTASKSREVRFYLKTVIGGVEYYSKVSRTYSIINAVPAINYNAYDSNGITTALTGNNKVVINGKSKISISMNSSAKKFATISKNSIYYNNSWHDGITSAVWSNPSNANIQFYTKDSRGYEKYETAKLSYISYVNPSCVVEAQGELMGGETAKIHIKLIGNFFNASFGAKANWVKIKYRYKKNEEAFGAWIETTPAISGNSAVATAVIENTNYLDAYTIEASIADALNGDIRSNQKRVSVVPVFNWGANNFNVNVPFTCVNNFTVDTNTPGMFGKYGFVWSLYGNTVGSVSNSTNFFLGIDTERKLHIGTQNPGSKTITWRTI